MDTSAIVNLVTMGVSKLVELVPMWMNASAEKRLEIEAKAHALVGGLDAFFADLDKKDEAATKAAQDAISGR